MRNRWLATEPSLSRDNFYGDALAVLIVVADGQIDGTHSAHPKQSFDAIRTRPFKRYADDMVEYGCPGIEREELFDIGL